MPNPASAPISPDKTKTIKNLHIQPFAKSPQELFNLLSAQATGLNSAQAQSRLTQFGKNALKHQDGPSIWSMIADQFKSILVLILIIASVFSCLVGETVDAVAIFAVVVVNGLLGFFQEYKAEKSLEELKKIETIDARVIRADGETTIPAHELVPGDILLLNEGKQVPADARLLEVHRLQVDESMLTGESVPSEKQTKSLPASTALADRSNMVYSGSLVTHGRGRALVVRTGMKTEMGKIAHELHQTPTQLTPLQTALEKLGRILAVVSLLVAVPGLIIGVAMDRDLIEMMMLTVSLAVSAIPEGLPIVVTIGLALGIKRMTKVNVLVRKLSTAESLGGTDVICTDKTGTITHNQMTVRQVYLPDLGMFKVSGSGLEADGEVEYDSQSEFSQGLSQEEISSVKTQPANQRHQAAKQPALKQLAVDMVLASDADLDYGDPTEQALLVLAEKLGLEPSVIRAQSPRLDELPFSSANKYMMVVVDSGDQLRVVIKGAVEKLLTLSEMDKAQKQRIMAVNEHLSSQGLRVLGVGMKSFDKKQLNLGNSNNTQAEASSNQITALAEKLEIDSIQDFQFEGLVGMYDPPRDSVAEAIKVCHRAGIRVMMITGDHKKTAMAIADQVGLDSIGAYSGTDLDEMDQAYFTKVVKEANIFARVSPRHKVKILTKLQELGHQVAMTGDGVNDAPALKRADVGIAVGDATDLTKGVSDMILLDNNFATISKAIYEGRRIFFNIKKFVRYMLSANFDEIARVLTSIIFGLPLSLLPIHILWLNLLTDSLPALALTVDKAEEGIMDLKPYRPKKEILRGVISFSILAAALGYVLIFGLFLYYLFLLQKPVVYARTVSFTATVMFELFLVFAARSDRPVHVKDLISNGWLWVSLTLAFLAQLIVIYTPLGNQVFDTVSLPLTEWAMILLISFSGFVMMELAKMVWNRLDI